MFAVLRLHRVRPGHPDSDGVTPNIGPAAGGNTVVVTGTGFVNVTNVSVIGLAPLAYTVDSSTQITLTIPPGGPTTGDIRITTTAGGPSGTGDGSRYTYRPVPAVTFLSPSLDFVFGGQTLHLIGITLTGATAVRFGAVTTNRHRTTQRLAYADDPGQDSTFTHRGDGRHARHPRPD